MQVLLNLLAQFSYWVWSDSLAMFDWLVVFNWLELCCLESECLNLPLSHCYLVSWCCWA